MMQRTSCAFDLKQHASSERREQWIQLMPRGEFDARDGRGPWRLSDPEAVIAATLKRARGASIPIDYDHQIEFSAKPGVGGRAVAAGWIKQLEPRDDGIWALVEWTEKAAAHLAAREYRFISPVFSSRKDTGEVTTIFNAALTNTPALELKAIASEGTMDAETLAALAELRTIYGLGDDAPTDAIVEAARTVASERTAAAQAPDPSRFVPIEALERVTAQLNRATRGVSAEAAVIAVDREIGSGKLVPALRDWAVELCSTNKPAFDAFVERTSGGLQHLFKGRLTQVPPDNEPAVTDIDREVASQLGHKPEDLVSLGKDLK